MTITEKIFTTPAKVGGISPMNKWEKREELNPATGKMETKNVDTGIRIGTSVSVKLDANAFDTYELRVKLDSIDLPISEEQVKESRAKDSPIFVLFENLSITPYNSWDKVKKELKPMTFDASATGLIIVTDNDAPASTPNPAPPKPQPTPKSTKA